MPLWSSEAAEGSAKAPGVAGAGQAQLLVPAAHPALLPVYFPGTEGSAEPQIKLQTTPVTVLEILPTQKPLTSGRAGMEMAFGNLVLPLGKGFWGGDSNAGTPEPQEGRGAAFHQEHIPYFEQLHQPLQLHHQLSSALLQG